MSESTASAPLPARGYRVVQWATGNIGMRSLRAVIERIDRGDFAGARALIDATVDRASPADARVLAFQREVATRIQQPVALLLNVTEFAEKPTGEYARSNLRVPGLPEGEYLTVFGQYIINPLLFEFLEENIKNNVRERGEFQLTSALDRLRREDGFLGLILDGRRYDIGLPQYYLETLNLFSSH